jgi:biotin carboxylase
MKKAVVLGGTSDHMRLIQIFKEKGYKVTLIDYLENPPAKNIADEHIVESTLNKEKVLELCAVIKPQIVITACIDQALSTMAYVCESLGLPCHISFKSSVELTNKEFMKLRFAEYQIPTAPFRILDKTSDLNDIGLSLPLVIKPPDSNSSKGIGKVVSHAELKPAFKQALAESRSQKAIVEEYIEGDELSIDVVVNNFEPVILMVTKNIKIKQNLKHFTIVQNLYPGTTDIGILEEIRRIAKKIALAFNLKNAPMLIQVMQKENKLYVIEFSARIGGGSKHQFIQHVTGFDILDYYVSLMTGEIPVFEPFTPRVNHACINYIYANPGIISGFEAFDRLTQDGVIEQSYFYMTKGMRIKSHIASNDRPAGFLVIACSSEELDKKITLADNSLRILDEQGHDIMIHGIYV